MKRGIVRVPEWAKELLKGSDFELKWHGWLVKIDLLSKVDDGMSAEFNGNNWMIGGVVAPSSWTEPIEEELSIDWSRVKVDAPIEVLMGGAWHPRHFAELGGNLPAYWLDGKTHHSAGRTEWDTASLDAIRFLKGENPEQWYLG